MPGGNKGVDGGGEEAGAFLVGVGSVGEAAEGAGIGEMDGDEAGGGADGQVFDHGDEGFADGAV